MGKVFQNALIAAALFIVLLIVLRVVFWIVGIVMVIALVASIIGIIYFKFKRPTRRGEEDIPEMEFEELD